VAPLTLVFWRRGLDCDISYGMESTPSSRPVSLGWKLLVLLLLAAGVVLGMIAGKQTNTHAEIKLLNIANLCSNIALMAVGVYWIVVKKLTGLGILMLILHHGSGVRPAQLTAHALKNAGAEHEQVLFGETANSFD
jgi:hypothetical protein